MNICTKGEKSSILFNFISVVLSTSLIYFVMQFLVAFFRYQDYVDGNLNLLNPRTGLLELAPPPPSDDPHAQNFIIQSSLAESILAVKVVGGVKKIYTNFQGTKIWMDLKELSKFKWSLTGQPVTIAEDFF